jgi:hypothetical protein
LFHANGQRDMAKLQTTASNKKDITGCDVRQASSNGYRPSDMSVPAGVLNTKKTRNYSHFEDLVRPLVNSPLTSGPIQEI